MGKFTHFNKEGNAIMVDVHAKDDTYRVAVAAGKIYASMEGCMRQSRDIPQKKEMFLGWRALQESWLQRKIRN